MTHCIKPPPSTLNSLTNHTKLPSKMFTNTYCKTIKTLYFCGWFIFGEEHFSSIITSTSI